MAMAPPRIFAHGPDNSDFAEPVLFARTRDIRADVQDFQRSLDRLTEATAAAQAAGDDTPITEAMAAEASLIARLKIEIEDALTEIKTNVFGTSPRLWSACGDEITHIDNLWNRVICELPQSGNRDEFAQRLSRMSPTIRQILIHTARLTIADRLNAHLKTARIGKAINFDTAFSDEIPDSTDRAMILNYLAEHPGAVNGVVDQPRGLVFRVSQSQLVRFATYLAPIIAAGIGALIAGSGGKIDDWLNISNWPTGMQDATAMLTGYFFVLIGAVAHVAIESLKQQRFGAGTAFLALDDALDWLHIRYLSICASVIWVLIGVFGLAATTSNIDWATAFFIGYSLDSVGGLFLQRFGQAVDRRTKAFNDQLLTGNATSGST